MGIVYEGHRRFFIDDNDGTYWTSEHKQQRLDPETKEPIDNSTPIEAKIVESETVSESTATVNPLQESVGFVDSTLKCDKCEFVAKTKAGLNVHKAANHRPKWGA